MMIEIQTEDFVLKSVSGADYSNEWLELLLRKDVFLGLNLPMDAMNSQNCMSVMSSYDNQTSFLLGIYSLKNQQLAGFYALDVDVVNKVGFFSVAVNNHLFKTIVWKTCDAFLDYFFDANIVDKISGRILTSNKRALYMLLANGRFKSEGILKQDCLLSDRSRMDVMVWSSFKNPRSKTAPFPRVD